MSSHAKQAALQCSTRRIARMFVKHQRIMMTEFSCSPSKAGWPGVTGVLMCKGDGVDSCDAPFAAGPAQGVRRGNGILPMSRARGGGS